MPLRLCTLTLLLLFAVHLHGQSQTVTSTYSPQMVDLIAQYKITLAALNKKDNNSALKQFAEDDMRDLMAQGWKLAADWAAEWLQLHPDASDSELKNIFVDFTPPPVDPEVFNKNLPATYGMEGSATRIAKDLYVVDAAYEESQAANATSSFFVVARDADGRFHQKWSIKPLAMQHYYLRDEIGRWAFYGSCGYYCGPLVASKVMPLPPAANAQPRFAIEAFQATNGNTLQKQFSIWQWNGTNTKNLIIQSYSLFVEDDRDVEVLGNLISVPTKEQTMSFSAYGCCEQPRGIWVIHLTPTKVQNLGHHFLQPQIEWLDQLLAAIHSKSPVATTLATPSVIAVLKDPNLEIDTISECNVLRSGRQGIFRITFGAGTALRLQYRLQNGRPYFTSAQVE